MLHLKVALIEPKYGDEQYVESSLEAGGFPVTMVTDEKAWAVKAPSRECVQQVQSLIPGCEVRVFHHVRYLMSPKALLYYPLQDVKRKVVLLTFDLRGAKNFLMVHLTGRHFWHLPWCNAADQLTEFLSTAFHSAPEVTQGMRPLGVWKVFKHHHAVIDLKTFLHFRLFHCHLPLDEVVRLFERCGLDFHRDVKDVRELQTFACTSDLFHSLMVVPKDCLLTLPLLIDGVNVDQWHLDAAKQTLNIGEPSHRRMRIKKIIN